MPNQQEPISKNNLDVLEVHSIFKTIQGEGIFAGRGAIFVRLYGCNLQCPFCDTDYTSTNENLTPMGILIKVKELIGNTNINLVVITGGEPFRQKLSTLLIMLNSSGFDVQIETNGTLCDEDINWNPKLFVVCSPKTANISKQLIPHIDAYKYVINHNSIDLYTGFPKQALGHPCHKKHVFGLEKVPIYVQPADMGNKAENKKNLKACIELTEKYGFILCLQLHKIIGLP